MIMINECKAPSLLLQTLWLLKFRITPEYCSILSKAASNNY
ncbi:hypothetical Protein YC6258_05343 [Gynuella sunshinyii YC6258]|uniref:Uncharacterized protein n=1 Tax=Gynuella sunshinyii YC6258 TaxID=1445510 RepID=A0A0C5VVP1_9GAMM|nr:hypothetical Protein YC6258_05343 [Gynuella sunshinyii YC6258]